MTKNEIIEQWFRQGVVQDIVKKVSNGARDAKFDDLVQIVYLNLLQKDEKIIRDLYESGQYKYYIARMVMLQAISNKSPFYQQVRNFSARSSELDYNKLSDSDNDFLYQVKELMKDLTEEEIAWVESYAELGTKADVAKQTGLSERYVIDRITLAINKIRRAVQMENIKAEFGINQDETIL